MLVFVIPFRHPLNTNKLQRAEYFLYLTLSSLLSQTSTKFKIIVVCNEVPNVDIKSNKIDFHIVDFPPPCSERRANISWHKAIEDKGAKLIAGFLMSLKYNPDYVFFVDSDDWININLVKFLLSKSSPVWYVDAGYFVDFPARRFKKKYGLLRYCGSTWIYDPNLLLEILNTKVLHENSSKEEILKNCSGIAFEIFSGHQKQWFYFRDDLKIDPKKIPFPAVSWVIGTGENRSSTFGNNMGLPIDRSFCELFGIPAHLSSGDPLTFFSVCREYMGRICSKLTWFRTIWGKKYYF